MADIATLGLRVDASEVERADRALVGLVDSSGRAEKSADRLSEAHKRSSDAAIRDAQAQQRIAADVALANEAYANNVITLQDYITAVEHARAEADALGVAGGGHLATEISSAEMAVVLARQSTDEYAESLRQAAAAGELAEESISANAIALHNAREAASQTAVATESVAKSSTSASAGVGRLNYTMGSLFRQVSNTHPVIGQLSATLGTFAMGGVITTGVLAGLSAIALAFRRLGEEAREAREQQEDAIEALERIAERRRVEALGPGGREEEQIDFAQDRLEALAEDIAEQWQRVGRAQAEGRDAAAALARERLQDMQNEFQRIREIVEQGEQEVESIRSHARRREAEEEQRLAEERQRQLKADEAARAAHLALLGQALDLDIQRDGLLTEALTKTAELRAIAEDITRDLEERVVAQERLNALQEAGFGNVDRQIRPQIRVFGQLQTEVEDFWESLPDHMKESLEAMNLFGQEGVDWAELFEENWVGAFQVVGASLGGLASQVANVVGAFAAGGPVMGALATTGAAVSIMTNDSARREFEQAHDAWERALDRFADLFADRSRLEQMRHQAERQAEATFEALMEALWKEAKSEKVEHLGRDAMREIKATLAGGDLEEATRLLHEWAEGLRLSSDAVREFMAEMEEVTARIERARQREISSMQDDVAVRMLAAQGLDAEAEALRRDIEQREELARAMELGDDALVRQIETLHAMERAALQTEEAIMGVVSSLNNPAGLNTALFNWRASMLSELPDAGGTTTSGSAGATGFLGLDRSGGTTISGGIQIYIQQRPGQSSRELAEEVGRELDRRRRAGDNLVSGAAA